MIQKLLHNRITKTAVAILPDLLFLLWIWVSSISIGYTLADLLLSYS